MERLFRLRFPLTLNNAGALFPELILARLRIHTIEISPGAQPTHSTAISMRCFRPALKSTRLVQRPLLVTRGHPKGCESERPKIAKPFPQRRAEDQIRTPIVSDAAISPYQSMAGHSFFEVLCKLGSTHESITSCLKANRANPYTLKTDL